MTATLELLTGQLLLQFFPISQLPGEYFEILHLVGHVLCGKSFIFDGDHDERLRTGNGSDRLFENIGFLTCGQVRPLRCSEQGSGLSLKFRDRGWFLDLALVGRRRA